MVVGQPREWIVTLTVEPKVRRRRLAILRLMCLLVTAIGILGGILVNPSAPTSLMFLHMAVVFFCEAAAAFVFTGCVLLFLRVKKRSQYSGALSVLSDLPGAVSNRR